MKRISFSFLFNKPVPHFQTMRIKVSQPSTGNCFLFIQALRRKLTLVTYYLKKKIVLHIPKQIGPNDQRNNFFCKNWPDITKNLTYNEIQIIYRLLGIIAFQMYDSGNYILTGVKSICSHVTLVQKSRAESERVN